MKPFHFAGPKLTARGTCSKVFLLARNGQPASPTLVSIGPCPRTSTKLVVTLIRFPRLSILHRGLAMTNSLSSYEHRMRVFVVVNPAGDVDEPNLSWRQGFPLHKASSISPDL